MCVIIKGRRVLTQNALWDRLWTHESNRLKQWPATGEWDMQWYRTEEEGDYHRLMNPIIVDIVAGRRSFARDEDIPLVPARPIDAVWFVEDQAGWWRECSLESRNRRVTSENSTRAGQVFAGLHSMEVFGIRSAYRPLVYVWVPNDWVDTVESRIWLAVPSPWLFMMFAHVVIGAAAALQAQ